MAWIGWSQQEFLVSTASTCQWCLLHLVRAILEPESTIELQLPVTFITPRIARSYQSVIVSGIFIRPGIVRDIVRATLVRATLISTGIVRGYVRVYDYWWKYQRACQSHTCQSHSSEGELSETMSETMSEHTFIAGIIRDIVRAILLSATWNRLGLSDHIRATFVTIDPQWISRRTAVPISWAWYGSSLDGCILLIYRWNQVILIICTVPLVDEHVLSVLWLCSNMLCVIYCNLWLR